MPKHPARLGLGIGLALTLTACGTAGAGPAPGLPAELRTPVPDRAAGSEIATVRGARIAIYRAERDTAPWKTLKSPNEYGAPRVLLVDRHGESRVRVLLPLRPNGSTGWVDTAQVKLQSTTRRVEIDADAFRFTVYDGERVLRTGKVATGTGGTPTPSGRFYFTELIRPADPDGPYGAYAYGLSGYSETLKRFAGGPGQLAVHGTDAPGRLGSKASHGCVRVSNADITWMAHNLPLGTPVVIDA